jgi:hypothetical protein
MPRYVTSADAMTLSLSLVSNLNTKLRFLSYLAKYSVPLFSPLPSPPWEPSFLFCSLVSLLTYAWARTLLMSSSPTGVMFIHQGRSGSDPHQIELGLWETRLELG